MQQFIGLLVKLVTKIRFFKHKIYFENQEAGVVIICAVEFVTCLTDYDASVTPADQNASFNFK